jgi:hypothetical protein
MKHFTNILGMLLLFMLCISLGYFSYIIKNYNLMGFQILIFILMLCWGVKINNDHE